MQRVKTFLLRGGVLTGAIIAAAAGLTAFEAHVVNVTAKIENALAMSTEAIDFGTVFPQEQLERRQLISLSQSFLAEDRVDDVEYFIRQKPKCAVTDGNGTVLVGPTATGHVFPGVANPLGPNQTQFDPDGSLQQQAESGDEYYVDCGPDPREPNGQLVGTWGLLPSLCPYISKHEDLTPDNDSSTPSFHKPFQIVNGQVVWLDTLGRLAKSDQDLTDLWTIDLKVPCFGDHCAQDWEDFVAGINPQASSTEYILPIELEHKIFGCDLWFEVSGVSLPGQTPTTTTLTVIKEVVNNHGGNNVVADFQLQIDGGNVTSGVVNPVAPGPHVVGELGVAGYEATFLGDCDVAGNVSLLAGENKTCTIVNDDIPPNITLIKSVINNDGGTATSTDFTMTVDGTTVPSGSSIVVTANAAHVIDEVLALGYSFLSITGSSECPVSLGGGATLDEGEAITCTITNDDNELAPPPVVP